MAVVAASQGYCHAGVSTMTWALSLDDAGVLTFQEDGQAGVAVLELTDSNGTVHTIDTLNLPAGVAAAFGMPAGSSLLNAGEKQITGISAKTVKSRGVTVLTASMSWAPPTT
jgi:hypothetical protein